MSNPEPVQGNVEIPKTFDVSLPRGGGRIRGDRDTRGYLEEMGLIVSESLRSEFYSVVFPEGWSFLGPRNGSNYRIYMDANRRLRFSVSIHESKELSHYVVDEYPQSTA